MSEYMCGNCHESLMHCACEGNPLSPVEELKGTFPLVLYFGNEKDREEFIAVVAFVMPNATVKKL